jgi:hypothetical protein
VGLSEVGVSLNDGIDFACGTQHRFVLVHAAVHGREIGYRYPAPPFLEVRRGVLEHACHVPRCAGPVVSAQAGHAGDEILVRPVPWERSHEARQQSI